MATAMAEMDANLAHLDPGKMSMKRHAPYDPPAAKADVKRPRLTDAISNTIELADGYTLELQDGTLILHEPQEGHPLSRWNYGTLQESFCKEIEEGSEGRRAGCIEKAKYAPLYAALATSEFTAKRSDILAEEIMKWIDDRLTEPTRRCYDPPAVQGILSGILPKVISEENYGLDRATMQKIDPSWGSSIIVPIGLELKIREPLPSVANSIPEMRSVLAARREVLQSIRPAAVELFKRLDPIEQDILLLGRKKAALRHGRNCEKLLAKRKARALEKQNEPAEATNSSSSSPSKTAKRSSSGGDVQMTLDESDTDADSARPESSNKTQQQKLEEESSKRAVEHSSKKAAEAAFTKVDPQPGKEAEVAEEEKENHPASSDVVMMDNAEGQSLTGSADQTEARVSNRLHLKNADRERKATELAKAKAERKAANEKATSEKEADAAELAKVKAEKKAANAKAKASAAAAKSKVEAATASAPVSSAGPSAVEDAEAAKELGSSQPAASAATEKPPETTPEKTQAQEAKLQEKETKLKEKEARELEKQAKAKAREEQAKEKEAKAKEREAERELKAKEKADLAKEKADQIKEKEGQRAKEREEKEAQRAKEREEKEAEKAEKAKAREEKEKDKEEKARAKRLEEEKKEKVKAKQASFLQSFIKKAPLQPEVESSPPSGNDFETTFLPCTVKNMAPVNKWSRNLKRDIREEIGTASQSPAELLSQYQSKLSYPLQQRRARQAASSRKGFHPETSVREVMHLVRESDVLGEVAAENAKMGLEKLQSRRSVPIKLLQVHSDRRPGWYGTWTRNSNIVSARAPFGQDSVQLDYSLDSDAEWEDEADVEGEDVLMDADEEEEAEAEMTDSDSEMDDWLEDDLTLEEMPEEDTDGEVIPSDAAGKNLSPLGKVVKGGPSKFLPPSMKENKLKGKKKMRRLGKKFDSRLIPYAAGPQWETTLGTAQYEGFKPYQIEFLNDAHAGINPFTFDAGAKWSENDTARAVSAGKEADNKSPSQRKGKAPAVLFPQTHLAAFCHAVQTAKPRAKLSKSMLVFTLHDKFVEELGAWVTLKAIEFQLGLVAFKPKGQPWQLKEEFKKLCL